MKNTNSDQKADINNCTYCKKPLTITNEDSDIHPVCFETISQFQARLKYPEHIELLYQFGLIPGQDIKLNAEGRISYLDLSNQEITQFPPETPTFDTLYEHLEYLDLSDNPIGDLTDKLKLCSQLKVLKVHDSGFGRIPKVLQDLPSLNYFSITEELLPNIEYLEYPKWFIDRVINGLDVWVNGYDNLELEELAINIQIYLQYGTPQGDIRRQTVVQDTDTEDLTEDVVSQIFKRLGTQLQGVVSHLDKIITILKKYPQDYLQLRYDIYYLISPDFFGKFSLVRDLVQLDLADLDIYD